MDLTERQDICKASVTTAGSATSRVPISAISMILLTACVSLAWSHYRLLYRDEFWEMWTDRISSIGQIIGIQLTNTVCLDPLAYHVLGHACIRAFGANTFAIRLPALLSVLLMQVCLFIFVRRIATERTAVFAMGFPALTCAMGYSMEGRPYGLVLACFGVAMVSWQTAAHRETGRTFSLVTLGAAVALALNTQYFGVLLLGPLCVAELFRTLQRKRFDLAMISSLVLGSTAVVLALPFMKAAKELRGPYGGGFPSPKTIIWAYIWTLANHTGTKLDRVMFVLVCLLVGISLWACGRQLRRKALSSWKPEEVFLITLAALPFLGYVVALFASPVLEPRFVIGVVIGISALTALGLFSLDSSERYEKLLLCALFLTLGLTGITHVWMEYRAATQMIESMKLNPEIRTALLSGTDQRLYIQDVECFAFLTFYGTDPDVRSRITLVYSTEQEEKWNKESVIPIYDRHLHNFAHISITPFEQVAAEPGTHLFVDFAEPSLRAGKIRSLNWLGLAFAADHANTRLLGHAFQSNGGVAGDVVSVNFHP